MPPKPPTSQTAARDRNKIVMQAAMTVFAAFENLTPAERLRVLRAAEELYETGEG